MTLEEELIKASEVLKSGGVVAFPTETVFGLGIIFDDKKAYDKMNKIKGRPEDKPYTMMLADPNEVELYANLNDESRKLVSAFMPGAITLLLPSKDNVPLWVTHNTKVIGIRVSSSENVRKLIKLVGKPLLVPSANKSGSKPALNSLEAKEIFLNEVDFYINGESGHASPSTIVDTCGKINIIREGDISKEEIAEVLKEN